MAGGRDVQPPNYRCTRGAIGIEFLGELPLSLDPTDLTRVYICDVDDARVRSCDGINATTPTLH